MMVKNGKVLLVDDEPDVLQYFEERFSAIKGVQLLKTSFPEEGIQMAIREKPEVVLMDLRMPKLGGEAALKAIKPLLPGTKFIIITGCGDELTRHRLTRDLGVHAYFDKPLDCDAVVQKVFELMRDGH